MKNIEYTCKVIAEKINYYRRIIPSYLIKKGSYLAFWHEIPEICAESSCCNLKSYYMSFEGKSNYKGPFDQDGIPILDYRGNIGKQYNPITISQYGLACINKYYKSKDEQWLKETIMQADWLVKNLEENEKGIPVWNHYFDWNYREILKAPWYSGLAQGNGISLLCRIAKETGDEKYYEAAEKAYISLTKTIDEGGVIYIDDKGDPWIEEVIVIPPTHILNGFLWALWGVWDYYLLTENPKVEADFKRFVQTLEKNIHRYDTGYWSLYELSGLRLRMVASPFYHALHCVQLRITADMTGKDIFLDFARKWEEYSKKLINRNRALAEKILFKLIHY